MSKISLKHSGGNVVSLNSPTNAPGAADVAFKLPNADGSAGQVMKTDGSGNLSFVTPGGGKILQVISATKTDTASTNITRDSDWTGHGLSVSITPSSASNKIFISGYFMVGVDNDENMFYKLFKGGSVITAATGDASSGRSRVTASVPVRGDQEWVVYSLPIHYLDTAGSTSSLTYTPAIGISSQNNKTIYVNRSEGDLDNGNYVRTISVLTAMEVAA